MRDIKQLHPELQKKIVQLQELCAANGIAIGISECLRTVAEQDALYAKGRTTGGSIVTNCKGSTYSSMHQWGVAFDFYLKVDVDGDGQWTDDIYNDASGLFGKVGKLGQSIGLEWGGAWKSPVDKPHFQLPDWGSTASKLKQQYGAPDKFMATWTESTKVDQNATAQNVTASKNKTEAAKSKSAAYNKSYATTANLNLRAGAGTKKDIILTIPKGNKVRCYGYYTKVENTPWLYVAYGKYTGFVSRDYLK
ncbi:MAG: M15 family metallopeptidase [Roseburia sp.]